MAPSGIGLAGGGMKLKNPFSPNTKNISPIRTRPMVGKKRVNDFGGCVSTTAPVLTGAGVVTLESMMILSWFSILEIRAGTSDQRTVALISDGVVTLSRVSTASAADENG